MWVSQISILEHLVFLVHINDLYAAIKYSELHHIADNTILLNFNSCVNSINKQVEILTSEKFKAKYLSKITSLYASSFKKLLIILLTAVDIPISRSLS